MVNVTTMHPTTPLSADGMAVIVRSSTGSILIAMPKIHGGWEMVAVTTKHPTTPRSANGMAVIVRSSTSSIPIAMPKLHMLLAMVVVTTTTTPRSADMMVEIAQPRPSEPGSSLLIVCMIINNRKNNFTFLGLVVHYTTLILNETELKSTNHELHN